MILSCESYPEYYAHSPNVKDLCECVTGYFRGQDKTTANIYDLYSDEERAMNEALELLELAYAAAIEGEIPS